MPKRARADSVTTVTTVKKGKATAKSASKSVISRRFAKVSLGNGFPDKIRTTMRYFEYNNGTASAGTVGGFFFKANGIYDPRSALGGHQPLGYDQLTPIYNHWIVNASRIKCTFSTRDEVDDVVHPVVVGIYDDDDGSNSLDYHALAEGSPRSRLKQLTTNNDNVVIYSSWKNTRTFGPATMSDPTQRGSITADPTETHQWYIWWYNIGNTSHLVNVLIDVEYDVTFFERKDLATS